MIWILFIYFKNYKDIYLDINYAHTINEKVKLFYLFMEILSFFHRLNQLKDSAFLCNGAAAKLESEMSNK